jgi:tRNA A37 methylthiotransferase MiaB
VLNCNFDMGKLFDIGLERLTGQTAHSSMVHGAATGQRATFFLETFGCQMNDHDSEKVAGVLLARGYRQVETPEAASMILYNTCSIREKAAQKVFSRLGEYRDKPGEGKIIGVLGCVATRGRGHFHASTVGEPGLWVGELQQAPADDRATGSRESARDRPGHGHR